MRRFLLVVLPTATILAIAGSVAWRFWPRPEPWEFEVGRVRLAVVNGCGVAHLAATVSDLMQKRGYDVYEVGDTRERPEHTTVVDLRDPNGANADSIARSLAVERRIFGLPTGRLELPAVAAVPDTNRWPEVEVVLGRDYRRFFPEARPLR